MTSGCAAPKPVPQKTAVEKPTLALIREGGSSLRIDGLPPLKGFANGRDSTFVHCLEVLLDGWGRNISYDDLMGVSGLAFRFQIRMDGWDTSSPDPVCGASVLDAMFGFVGCDYELRVVHRDDLTAADALVKAIHESIDHGVPVLAANIIPPEDWGIITGYRQQRQWICRSYNGGAEAVDMPATAWPTGVVLLTNRRKPPAERLLHVDAIRRSIELFEQGGTGDYAVGRKAFSTWAEMVRAPRDNRYVHPNFWIYISLIDARAAAVRYLKSHAAQFGSKDRFIVMAADWYDQEVRMLIQNLQFVPNARMYPTSIPPAETRNQQIETIQKALMLEEKAIDSLKRAR
jgi:hypothetical protein